MGGNNESWEIFINIEISTHLLPCDGWFCPVVSEPVEPYFTRLLRVLSFCLGVPKIVNFCGNGVVEFTVGVGKINIDKTSEKSISLIQSII